eukprot:CAMPEP_0206539324 /NCGR_PEP_ID=MMETSP0325_2-20121206/8370_1 /ASSEMBLY_ACC=CAM_ASM_000347 /TAXON_ID=2866 /ORGANISM="Crypthecodinium cohnii, Strain Seligo" /LENGTH=533 /DNA_ID=CAMNT_0054036891 /DNA_START=50 /DNA_END=1648 /DNA_ORIENTATION=+
MSQETQTVSFADAAVQVNRWRNSRTSSVASGSGSILVPHPDDPPIPTPAPLPTSLLEVIIDYPSSPFGGTACTAKSAATTALPPTMNSPNEPGPSFATAAPSEPSLSPSSMPSPTPSPSPPVPPSPRHSSSMPAPPPPPAPAPPANWPCPSNPSRANHIPYPSPDHFPSPSPSPSPPPVGPPTAPAQRPSPSPGPAPSPTPAPPFSTPTPPQTPTPQATSPFEQLPPELPVGALRPSNPNNNSSSNNNNNNSNNNNDNNDNSNPPAIILRAPSKTTLPPAVSRRDDPPRSLLGGLGGLPPPSLIPQTPPPTSNSLAQLTEPLRPADDWSKHQFPTKATSRRTGPPLSTLTGESDVGFVDVGEEAPFCLTNDPSETANAGVRTGLPGGQRGRPGYGNPSTSSRTIATETDKRVMVLPPRPPSSRLSGDLRRLAAAVEEAEKEEDVDQRLKLAVRRQPYAELDGWVVYENMDKVEHGRVSSDVEAMVCGTPEEELLVRERVEQMGYSGFVVVQNMACLKKFQTSSILSVDDLSPV